MTRFIPLAVLLTKIASCVAGFVPPAELCLPSSGLKELSGCVKWTDLRDECNAKESEEARLECYCTQEYLSSLYDCESDIQLCLASHMFDNQFNQKIARWHSTCDSRISSSVTTPALPTITDPYDFGACSRLYLSCVSADRETNLCSQKHLPTSSLSYISCACQPPIYSLFSECQYNGNVSCKRTTAAESNILGYSVCSHFWSGSETLSSIDWTSELGITSALAAEATMILVQRDEWLPQPTATGIAVPASTSGNIEEYKAKAGDLKKRELRFSVWLNGLHDRL